MGEESRLGPMVRNMKVYIRTGKNMGRALSPSLMEVSTMVSLSRMRLAGLEGMSGQTKNGTMEDGKRTKCTATASFSGKTANDTKATL